MKKLKTQSKSWKNSSLNSKKTQKTATPVELNWRKIVQKKSLPYYFKISAHRIWSLVILGSLMFIPGVYHVNIAVRAYFGHQGYSYDQIPSMD